ncbi:hypothetical protein QA640_44400 (plasmid) [Bradyrhizobium sp. CB82]|uniref:hypothetical protein n=1 Tax=Bradyrhizobium sp. CB82 TaxID=3039159 RepID=UPI0024B19922|nr:hypothetical protein [Bradyrhizobium sp. CB82]WFU45857.1 hypothetical protein QA640_44400 [Bradyrhizobium sp. CB82]
MRQFRLAEWIAPPVIVPLALHGTRQNLGRATAAAALRKARQLLQEGYIDVRICTPRGQILLPDEFNQLENQKETDVANGERRGIREAKKPKKEKVKIIAAAPSQKAAAWQPSLAPGKRK